MKRFLWFLALSTWGVALLVCGARAVVLDRPPEILEHRPVGSSIRLLWAPGGNRDGTLHQNVISYTVSRRIGDDAWWDISTGDARAMTHQDNLAWMFSSPQPIRWDRPPVLMYRVTAKTRDGATTPSEEVIVTPSLPAWIQEVNDGKARLAWLPSQAPPGYPVHVGYVVQKKIGRDWVDLAILQTLSYIDLQTTTGISEYRVVTVYTDGAGAPWQMRFSNAQRITIQPMCDGQSANPYPLVPIDIVDHDGNGYDGDDIAYALERCQGEQYEDLRFPGNGDGAWDPGEGRLFGGCILRALPVTYENVAITITSQPAYCSGDDVIPPFDPQAWSDLVHPRHCLDLDLPAGLVIEGHAAQTVFRSPVWTPPYLPAAVLEFHRRTFRLTLRNLAIDGRKHEQVFPAVKMASEWHAYGLRIWSQFAVREIEGDGLGNDDKTCNRETCTEMPGGNHDADGVCEAWETCLDARGERCDNDVWTNAEGCYAQLVSSDGCIHNVEVRNTLSHGVTMEDAQGWIIEDSQFHDVGCVNRGYGFDCPRFDQALDSGSGLSGFKMASVGLAIGSFTEKFKVRRNEFFRTAKYALSFKNDTALSCHGLMKDHEVYDNDLYDLGGVGIYAHGTAGAWFHHNTIDGTTTFGEPDALNPSFDAFSLSLGGLCSHDNVYADNVIKHSAGLAIMWTGAPEMVDDCGGGGCRGPTFRNNLIEGTCLEKYAAPPAPGKPAPYTFGSIHFHGGASGTVSLENNTLTDSRCRHALSAFGPVSGAVGALDVRISQETYESGPNSASSAQDGFYCGPLHAHGSNRKIVVGDATHIDNLSGKTLPKACIGFGATTVDHTSGALFGVGPYEEPHITNYGTVVECSSMPSHPDCR